MKKTLIILSTSSGKVSVLFLDKDRARRGLRGIVTSTETAASSCSLATFFNAISNSLKATPVTADLEAVEIEVETELFSVWCCIIEMVVECCSTFVVSIVVCCELDDVFKLVETCCCCWWPAPFEVDREVVVAV